MALTGHLSDLSLSELIEFFCNQRKSGRLKVLYSQGPGYFFLHTGSVVDARIGVLSGIEAVYFALTLPNAEFEFNVDAEATERTINQPWTQVVLEGLRRLDEGIEPEVAFPPGYVPEPDELAATPIEHFADESNRSFSPAMFGFAREAVNRKPLFIGAIAVAVVASVAVIGVPAGWYSSKPKPVANETTTATAAPTQSQPDTATPAPAESAPAAPGEDPAAVAARRQRERDKAKRDAARAQNEAAAVQPQITEPSKPGSKRVTVTVSYDESGRVTQASGGDATAVRIARQKRFPPGKAGSATITIPIN
ncbi:MAG TPA: DUF4388 domain-containing protein [Pyrinomonadaceae bacterium]|nr:DUF4388 domain-containing protein [Pyrinomonadaceae bacterium]